MFCKYCGKNIYELEKCPFCGNNEAVQEKTDAVKEEIDIPEKKLTDEKKETKKEKLQYESAEAAIEDWEKTTSIGKVKGALITVLGILLFGSLFVSLGVLLLGKKLIPAVITFIEGLGAIKGGIILYFIIFAFLAIEALAVLFEVLSHISKAKWIENNNIDCRKIIRYGKKTDKDSNRILRDALLIKEDPKSKSIYFARVIILMVSAFIGAFCWTWIGVNLIITIHNVTDPMLLVTSVFELVTKVEIIILFFIGMIFNVVDWVLLGRTKNKAEENLISGYDA